MQDLLNILGDKTENVAKAFMLPMERKWLPQEKACSMIVGVASHTSPVFS